MMDNLEKNIQKFLGQDIEITQKGFVESKYCLKGIKYFIQEDILNIVEEQEENYFKINVNQIYKIDVTEKSIKIYIDNDLKITIKRI